MKAIILSVLLLVVLAAAVQRPDAEVESLFAEFVAKYNKAYTRASTPAQYQKRFEIFRENLAFIDAHNAKEGETYTMEMNKFGDLTAAEFEQVMGIKPRSSANYKAPKHARAYVPNLTQQPPKDLDWRTKDGIVNKVKNQGGCGSCWAFSAAGAIESAWALKHKNLTRLSEQQLVDCSDADMGCQGGFQHHGIEHAMEVGGMDEEACYPYTGRDGTCNFKKDCIAATVHSYGNVTNKGSPDEPMMVAAMFEHGPLASAVYVKSSDWRFYKKGVYTTTGCPTGYFQLNHAIILVGYGNEGGKDFWIIRNSWGADWGNAGHMNIARNARNMCGIATDPQWVKAGDLPKH